jgi:RNA polymerase sigma-70 factor (ECF subfamily)
MFRLRRSSEPKNSPETGEAELDPEARHDERLLLAAQKGDLPSFNAIVVRHERSVYSLCLRMLRDTASAEDAAQETFIKAWTAVGTFKGGLVRPWLLRIATNRCYDILRARGRRPADSLDAELFEVEPVWTSQSGDGADPEDHAARIELSGQLERLLDHLPDDQRLVVILSDIHGYPYEEIAEITGAAIGTVKSRLSRARGKLRDLLRDDPNHRERFARLQRSLDG